MVQSKVADVDSYLAEADPTRRPWLARIRDVARASLPGHVEEMQWGMPAYSIDGRAIFAFASQKQHVSLYLTGIAVPDQHAQAVARLDHGKGCIRFRKPETIDFDLLAALLRDGYQSVSS